MPNNDDSFNQLGSPCYVAQLMYEAMDVCERRYRAYDPKDLWIMVDNDNKLHSYASKKPNQLNNFGPCWVVICWLTILRLLNSLVLKWGLCDGCTRNKGSMY